MKHDFSWLTYLSTHQKRATRVLHYIATGLVCLAIILSLLTKTFLLILIAILLFVALTAFSHSCIEHRCGRMRTHPLLTLVYCFRMSFCALTGHITEDLEKPPDGSRQPSDRPEIW